MFTQKYEHFELQKNGHYASKKDMQVYPRKIDK